MYVALLELLELLEFGKRANERGDVDNLRVVLFFFFPCRWLFVWILCVSFVCVCRCEWHHSIFVWTLWSSWHQSAAFWMMEFVSVLMSVTWNVWYDRVRDTRAQLFRWWSSWFWNNGVLDIQMSVTWLDIYKKYKEFVTLKRSHLDDTVRGVYMCVTWLDMRGMIQFVTLVVFRW